MIMTETLEEILKRYPLINQKIGFKAGVTWQQERSYSEEEVLNLLWKLYTTPNYMANFDTKADLIEWFEQFKKK